MTVRYSTHNSRSRAGGFRRRGLLLPGGCVCRVGTRALFRALPPVLTLARAFARAFALTLTLTLAPLVLSLALAFVCSPVFAAPPQKFVIEKTLLRADAGRLIADIALSVDDEDGLRDLLKDGAVLELAVAAQVERQRSLWTNASVADERFVSALRHDPLTRDFVVTVPGIAPQQTLRDRNLTRLLHISWRKLSLPLLSLNVLQQEEPGSRYLVTLTFTLQHTEVPPWLEKNLVFWSSSVVPEAERLLEYPFMTGAPPQTPQGD